MSEDVVTRRTSGEEGNLDGKGNVRCCLKDKACLVADAVDIDDSDRSGTGGTWSFPGWGVGTVVGRPDDSFLGSSEMSGV